MKNAHAVCVASSALLGASRMRDMRSPPGHACPPLSILYSSTAVPSAQGDRRAVRTRRRCEDVSGRLFGATVELLPRLDGERHRPHVVLVERLSADAAVERQVLVGRSVDDQYRDRARRIAVHRQLAGDDGDRGDPVGEPAGHEVRHHAAVREARREDAVPIDRIGALDRVEQRADERGFIDVRRLRVAATAARVPREQPLVAESPAARGIHDDRADAGAHG